MIRHTVGRPSRPKQHHTVSPRNDRVDGDELKLTHEVLATMLGVRRSGVTVALQEFERTGLISHKRGKITVLDRGALETSSNDAYFPISER